ncbi:Trm112 family protein [Sphaerotilus sp.]|jgi:uncharacterized protein|uniref:Trm112 family protein n=1 Tax=Sphaerotilus sp. TaxID=2093942 RepID=UPI0034E2BCB4
MDTRLMQLLVCPLCKGPLNHDHATHELVCPADRLAFPIRDGMAVMLESEARTVDPDAPPPSPFPLPDAAPTP